MSQKRIVITSKQEGKGGKSVRIADADTGMPLSDIAHLVVTIARDDVIVADVSYSDGSTQRRYVEKVEAIISREVVMN